MTFLKKSAPDKYARADMDQVFDALNSQVINVGDSVYGAVMDGSANAAPAIQAAINDLPARGGTVYLPPGIYLATTSIVFPTDRQCRLVGAGPWATQINVTPGTTATPGIIHIRGTELRSSVEQLAIFFQQPDTDNRNAMTQYVPAIYAQGVARFRVQHCRIAAAWDVIDMRGNSNCEIDDLEMSHFNTGIQIDGSLDTIRISHLHDWVFYTTPSQMQAVFDSLNRGIVIGRTDGTHIENSLFICGTGIRTIPSVTSPGITCNVLITNCAFDTFNGLQLLQGRVRVGNSYFTTITSGGSKSIYAVPGTVTAAGVIGTEIQADGCYFYTDGGTGGRLIELVGQVAGTYLKASFTGCLFDSSDGDHSSIFADASASGGIIQLAITGNQFCRQADIAYTAPTIYCGTNVRGTIVSNVTKDKGTGAGNFLTTGDPSMIVEGNQLLGWGLQFVSIVQAGSNNMGGVLTGTHTEQLITRGYHQITGNMAFDPAVQPPFAVRRFTGTLDGAGAANVAHGLVDLQYFGLIVQAWYKGGAGAMVPLDVIGVDATNIILSGGVAATPYRAIAIYSNNGHVW